MSLRALTTLFCTGLLSSAFALGCAAPSSGDDDGDESEVESSEQAVYAAVTPGTFKLYDEARITPYAPCDLFTSLELGNSPTGVAKLKEVVTGTCKLAVYPDLRSYKLHNDGTSCGSKFYWGRRKVGSRWVNIRVTDHRSRTCKDLVPAKIIVDESIPSLGVAYRMYSHDAVTPPPPPPPPPPPQVGTWLSISPKQCGTNAWSGAQPGADASPLTGEEADVDNYFRSKSINLEQVGFLTATEPRIVCFACSCSRGDVLVVKAKDSTDAQNLITNFGFTELEGAYGTGPKQCGQNGWQSSGNAANEEQQLTSWLKSSGAASTDAGFMHKTKSMAVCMACSCPRGDFAIALPKDASARTKLGTLGWTEL